jgi:RHS repeat-associated protein
MPILRQAFKYLIAVLSVLSLLIVQKAAQAGELFDFKVLAQSGQAGIGSIKNSGNLALSFNDSGQAAFVASLTTGGEGIFVADEKRLENITPSYSANTFSTRLQINNNGIIVSRFSGGISPPSTWIATWNTRGPDAREVVDISSGVVGSFCSGGDNALKPCQSYRDCYQLLPDGSIIYWPCRTRNFVYSTFLNPSINNSNQVAYLGSKPTGNPGTNVLVVTGPSGEFKRDLVSPNNLPKLMLGDNGMALGRLADSGTPPIRLFGPDLTTYTDIATSATFSSLGQNPGLSDSGEIAAFAGTRSSDGQGIFVYYVEGQELVRVANIRTNSPDDPNPVANITQDVRVSVNNDGVVLFQGINASGQSAIFRTVVRHCNNQTLSLPIKQVIAAGDTITNLPGTVQSLSIYDSLNNKTPGEICFLGTMPGGLQAIVKATPKKCDVCSVCAAGQAHSANNSVEVSIGLGASVDGSVSGSFQILSDLPSTNLASPSGLSLTSGGFSTIFANGNLRQVKGKLLADIIADTPYRYHIDFYTNSGTFNSGTGLFAPIGSPFSALTIENPDAATSTNRLQIKGSNGELTTFVHHPEYNGWELITGFANGTRKEALERSTNGTQRNEIRTIRDVSDNILSRVSSTFETFAWGEELIQTIEDPAGVARTTTYSYYTNAASDGNNHGHVRKVIYPNGRWEFYKEYDPVLGLLKSVSQFRSNPYIETTNWPDSNNRSSELIKTGTVETRTEFLKGHPISRRFHNEPAAGYTTDAIATNPSVTNWSDASNLSTITYQYLTSNTNGAKAGQTRLIINPDGTANSYAYYDEFIPDPTFSGGGTSPLMETLRTDAWTGEPNTNYTAFLSGTFSRTITDLLGNQLSSLQYDIASGLLIGSETVSSRDAFGRATQVNYLDGTYITRSYDCCGLASATDREGIVTTYNPDHSVALDLDHDGTAETYYGSTVTRAGISTHTLTDGLGRSFMTVLQGTNGSLIVQDERHYNAVGDLDWSKDAARRTTTYSNAYVGDFTVNTTTFADGGQSIGISLQDDSSYEIKGDAVQGLRSDYDVVLDDGIWVQTSTQTRLTSDGAPSPEYTTTFTDLAGRTYKTQYPWPDGGTNVLALNEYNSKGQLFKSTDPDGVSMLYEYNARGELETTAIDVANPGVIDLAGTDRITRMRGSVINNSSHGVPVRISTAEIWESDNLDQPTVLQLVETTLEGTTNWTTQYGLTTRTVTASDRNNQSRIVTTFNPDHTSSVSVFYQGQQTSFTRYDSNSVQIARTTFAYDAFGRLLSSTDARNGTTFYTYYDDGQIHTVTTPDPEPTASGSGYDPQTTSYTYFRDPVDGIKTVTTLPDAGTVTQQFFPSGQLKKTWGARTYPAAYTYDRSGRVDTLTTWQQFDFNTGNGIGGAATTKWHYNSRGLLAFKEYADGKGPTYTYTAGGKLNTRVWARGVSTSYGYNPKSGDLLTLTYSDSTPAVTNAYDRLGRLKVVTDASGVRQFGYQSGQTTTEAYTAGAFAGITLQRGFDLLNRLQSLTVTNRATTLYQVVYGYDAASRLQSVTSGPDVATYSYHTNSDLVNTLVQTHSNQVRLTTTKLYDKLNRLQRIGSVPSADSPISFAYQYNSANQRTLATLANGEYWTYGYDALGQVTNGIKHFPNNTPVPGYSFGYQFDHIGNRLAATRDNRTDAYSNNALNQIQSINFAPWLHVLGQVNSNATITVNGLAPVLTNGYYYAQLTASGIWNSVNIQARVLGAVTNGADGLAEQIGHTFNAGTSATMVHDPDGNLSSDERWIYTWDAENRLVRISTRSNLLVTSFPQMQIGFVNDSQSRTVGRTAQTFDNSTQVFREQDATKFIHNGAIPLITFSTGLHNTELFAWGTDQRGSSHNAAGVGGLISVTPLGETDKAYLVANDGAGNIVALASSLNSQTVAQYDYGAFGETLRASGPAAEANPLRFSTKYYDEFTGLSNFGARHYLARTGMWPGRDPSGEQPVPNLYSFVAGDAINRIEIDGRNWFWNVHDPELYTDLGRYFADWPNITFQPFYSSSHSIKICGFPKKEPISSWADKVFADLESFEGFEKRNNSLVRPYGNHAFFRPKDISLWPRAFLPAPFPATLSDYFLGTDYWLEVELSTNKRKRILTGQTLPGHLLDGKRFWFVRILEGECCIEVTTAARERSVNVRVESVRTLLGGKESQIDVWRNYLNNIADKWEQLAGTTHSGVQIR